MCSVYKCETKCAQFQIPNLRQQGLNVRITQIPANSNVQPNRESEWREERSETPFQKYPNRTRTRSLYELSPICQRLPVPNAQQQIPTFGTGRRLGVGSRCTEGRIARAKSTTIDGEYSSANSRHERRASGRDQVAAGTGGRAGPAVMALAAAALRELQLLAAHSSRQQVRQRQSPAAVCSRDERTARVRLRIDAAIATLETAIARTSQSVRSSGGGRRRVRAKETGATGFLQRAS